MHVFPCTSMTPVVVMFNADEMKSASDDRAFSRLNVSSVDTGTPGHTD